jgi:hypothetical protein
MGKLQFLCSICTSSTFGKLKDLKLVNLHVFGGFWEAAAAEIEEEHALFPFLEIAVIEGCPKLTTLPTAPKLRVGFG